ncbi:MAG: DUF6240 domain-containing protein [Clostridia bacterium]|nr:DUF6240 domain-containing protein [Clostridia bacterium]
MKTNMINNFMNTNKIAGHDNGLFSCLKKGDKLSGIISEITEDKVKIDMSNKSYLISKDKFSVDELKLGNKLDFEVVNVTKDKTELKKINSISNEDMLKSVTDGLVDAKSVFESYDFVETDDKEEVADDSEENTKSISKNIYEESIKKLINHEDFNIMKISTEEFVEMIIDYNIKSLSGLKVDDNLISSIKDGTNEIPKEMLDNMKNLVAKTESINNLNDKDVEEITLDFVKNGDFLTLNKIYETQFKVCDVIRNDSEFDVNNFEDNIKSVLQNEGIEITDENFESAKKLITNEIDVTKENVDRFNEVKHVIKTLDAKEVVNKYIELNELDDNPQDVCLESNGRMNMLEEVVKDSIDKVSKDDNKLQLVIDANKGKINNATLMDVIDAAEVDTPNLNVDTDLTTKLKKELNEVRLMFTAKSAYSIYSKGINVELAPIKETLKELQKVSKHAEMIKKGELLNNAYNTLADTKVRNFAIYKDVDQIKNSPLMQVAKLCKERIETNIFDVAKENHIEFTHEDVVKAYDDNMITSRYTLKGEYNIASRNISELLKSVNIEDNDLNKKCAIILSLTGKEVNEESINSIKSIETKLEFITNNATPKVVKSFVDEGVDITMLKIDELADRIQTKIEELHISDSKANINNKEMLVDSIFDILASENIPLEVKDAMLGIYKVFNKITKYGNAGAGILGHDEEELSFTLREVFDATKVLERSRSGNAINQKIDDAFGMLEDIVENDNNAKKTLDRSFAKIREELNRDYELISSEDIKKLADFAKNNDIMLEKLYDDIDKVTLEEIKLASDFEESKNLVKDLVLTTNLISNSEEIKEEANKLAGKMKEGNAKVQDEHIHIKTLKTLRDKDEENILDRFENETEGLEETLDVTNRIISQSENELMRIDAINKVLRLAYNKGEVSNSNIQIPIMVGDEITNINLIFDDNVRGDAEKVKMLISINLPNIGETKADIVIDEEKNAASINFITSKESANMIMNNSSEIINMIEDTIHISSMSVNGKNINSKRKETNLYLRNKKID